MSGQIAYLDSSAMVKRYVRESEKGFKCVKCDNYVELSEALLDFAMRWALNRVRLQQP